MFTHGYGRKTNELGINYKVSKCHFARPLSIHGLHGNPNSLYQYLLFYSVMVSFHSGVHQNQTICHLMKTNENVVVAGWVFQIFFKKTTIFLVFNIFYLFIYFLIQGAAESANQTLKQSNIV